MEITIKIKDKQGNEVEVVREFREESLISHNFSKIEDIVENIRTEMLKDVEHKILERNQSEYVKKHKKNGFEWCE